MGTTAEKLTYLNDTKQLLKENINNLGGNLTNEPFRQYASVLEDIYESLPKVSGIGASLSLSPSMVGKIKLNEIQGDTLQDGTPTPSSPVPIESVTGLQNVNVCGKNLINGLLDNSTTGKKLERTINADENFYLYIKTNNTTSDRCYAFLDSVNVGTIWLSNNNGTLTFSGSRNFAFNRIRIQDNTTVSENMLTLGSTATEYEPYKGNTYEVNLGKNLFDKSVSPSSQNGTTTTELDTGIRATTTATGQNKYTGIKLPNPSNLLGKTLTISANISISGTNTALIRFYWLNGNTLTSLIANSISTTGSGQITIPSSFPENTNGIAIVFSSNSGSSTSQVGDYVDYTNVQLEKGSQATSYSPYFTSIELNKIGDYKDRIYKDNGNWYVEKNIGKVVLDGYEQWSKNNQVTAGYLIINNSSSPFYNDVGNYGGYSNYFVSQDSYVTWTGAGKCGFNSSNVFWCMHTDTSLNTLEAFVDWVKAHPFKVLYVKATPTTEVITNTELIEQLESLNNAKSEDGTTNINVTSEDLSMILNVGVLKGDA